MSDRYEPARREAGRIAEDILAAGRNSRSEADLRSKVSHILLDFAERNGIPLESREEYTIASGLRPDTIYNQLVVEYKAPGTLSNARRHRQTEVAILQIQSYLDSLSGRGGGRPQRMSGIVLDGRFLIFVRVFPTTRQTDPPVEVAAQSIELLLRHLISLSTGAAILPENLLDDFGITRERTKALVGAFYQTLDTTEDPLVRGLFQQWKLYFTEVAGFEVESKQSDKTHSMACRLSFSRASRDVFWTASSGHATPTTRTTAQPRARRNLQRTRNSKLPRRGLFWMVLAGLER